MSVTIMLTFAAQDVKKSETVLLCHLSLAIRTEGNTYLLLRVAIVDGRL